MSIRSAIESQELRGRILVIVNVFNPDRGGGGAIFSDLCYGLADLGYDVTVRCAYPYYPEWKDKSNRNGFGIERLDDHGVHVERYGIFIPSKPKSLIQRLMYEASFFLSLLRSISRGRDFDLVMVYCPLVGAVGFAGLNKLFYRKPLWLNVQDLSADAAAASGIAKSAWIRQCLNAVQSTLFNQADVWSSISPVMIERLQQFRHRKQPILYLPNWLNDSMAREIRHLPGKTGRALHRDIQLLYAGNIGGKQDLLRFCKILHESTAAFRFRIHGNGAEANTIRSWVESTHDPRFTYGPFLEETNFAQALHETDFFVITEKTGSGGSFIPCKMISGIASGSAILAVSDKESPLGREMNEYSLGPWFSWERAPEVSQLFEQLRVQPQLLWNWQRNALQRAMFYERDKLVAKFDRAIRAILSSQGKNLSDLSV